MGADTPEIPIDDPTLEVSPRNLQVEMLDPNHVVDVDSSELRRSLTLGREDFSSETPPSTPSLPFPSPMSDTPHSLIHNPRYKAPSFGVMTCGANINRYPPLLWTICVSIPLVYLVLMFGVIPIGERQDDDDEGPGAHRFYHYWVFTCVVSPINMTVISFLNSGIFLSAMGVARPFRVHWSVLAFVFAVQVIVFNLIVPFVGTFDFFGAASLVLCYLSNFLAIYHYETWKVSSKCTSDVEAGTELKVFKRYFWQYFKVAIAFLCFFMVLILWMWAYSHVGSGFGQKMLPFAMTVGVFIVRKVMLALTDSFPLGTAMLISGFWVENIYDMFQTMAYRNVKDPINYVTIWFTNCLSLLANVFFLLDMWFEFRIWIKAYLPLAFRGKCTPWRLGVEADLTEDDNERGHSNNKIGYHRRQARFFMYKLFSKCVAALFYLLISTVLRYGVNRKLFPFHTDSEEEYYNSLVFSLVNFIFLCLAGLVAFTFAKIRHPKLVEYFREQAPLTLTSRYMAGCIVALLINNGIIAISGMMVFNMVFYVVGDHRE